MELELTPLGNLASLASASSTAHGRFLTGECSNTTVFSIFSLNMVIVVFNLNYKDDLTLQTCMHIYSGGDAYQEIIRFLYSII